MNGETASETARTLVTGMPVRAAPPDSSGGGLPPGLPLQTRPDQVFDIPVENFVRVVSRQTGPVVLDVLLVEHVGADLRPPLDGLLLTTGLGLLLEALLLLPLEQPAAQDRHRLLAVLDLRLAVLAAHDDLLGRATLVDDTYGRVRRIHRLSPRTRGAENVHTDIARVDVHLDAVIDLGHDVDGSETRVTPALRVERAHPHQAVHTTLDRQQPESPFPANDQLRIIDGPRSGVIADQVYQFDLETPPFGEATVHAEEHAGPVGSLVTTGARSDRKNRGTVHMVTLEEGFTV